MLGAIVKKNEVSCKYSQILLEDEELKSVDYLAQLFLCILPSMSSKGI